MFGLNSLNKVKKLIFNPVANGIRPNIVVIAVNKTGLRRALPPLTIASNRVSLSTKLSLSIFNSTSLPSASELNDDPKYLTPNAIRKKYANYKSY